MMVDTLAVTKFLDWLTADGNEMEFAVIGAPLESGEIPEPSLHRNGKPVTFADMERWADFWFDFMNQVPGKGHVEALVRSAIMRVQRDKVYPKREN